MIAYKLVRQMKDGSLSPLFINQKSRLPLNEWMQSEKCYNREKDGFKYRPFWHCTSKPVADHLSKKNRVWVEIEMEGYQEMLRPNNQGGLWYLAEKIKINKIL